MNENLDELLSPIVAGDADAFGRFVAGAELSVRRGLRSFAAFVDTEAIVQEAFLRVWQAAPRFVPDGRDNALLRLTSRTARNLALSELRRHRTTPFEEGAAFEGEVEVQVVTADPLLRSVILECLEKLVGPTRAALGARLDSGGIEPDTVLAERVGMRPNTFLQNVSRGRKLVAECLEGQGVALPHVSAEPTRTEAP